MAPSRPGDAHQKGSFLIEKQQLVEAGERAPTAVPVAAPTATGREGRAAIGARLRRLRQDRAWTLADVAARTGLAVSTLSKVERGRMSLAYDKFGTLAATLGLNIAELFAERDSGGECPQPVVTRRGAGQAHRSGPYLYEILNAGVSGRRMMPVRGRILARSREEFPEAPSHPGEEFLYVLSGAIALCIEGQEPIPLDAGDSVYFDSGQAHVYLSTGEADAEILTVMLPRGPRRDGLGEGQGHGNGKNGTGRNGTGRNGTGG